MSSIDRESPSVDRATAPPAPRMARLGANLTDVLIAGVALTPAVEPLHLKERLQHAATDWHTVIIVLGIQLVAYVVLHGYLLATRGQTIGKWLFRIRIVGVDDQPVSLERIVFLRFLPMAVLAVLGSPLVVLDAALIMGPASRCGHDYLAQTRVIAVS